MSIKLTETQQLLLSAAIKRDDRCVVFPSSLKGGAAQKIAAKLIAGGFLKEITAKAEMPIWRRDETTSRAYSLKVTAAGVKLVVVDRTAPSPETSEESDAPAQADPTEPSQEQGATNAEAAANADPGVSWPRTGTKIAQVVALLQRDDGATLGELIASTGWLPHTTRAALTGLRKRGYSLSIDRTDKERGSTYRITRDQKPEDEVINADAAIAVDAAIATRNDVASASRRSKKAVDAVTRQARKAA